MFSVQYLHRQSPSVTSAHSFAPLQRNQVILFYINTNNRGRGRTERMKDRSGRICRTGGRYDKICLATTSSHDLPLLDGRFMRAQIATREGFRHYAIILYTRRAVVVQRVDRRLRAARLRTTTKTAKISQHSVLFWARIYDPRRLIERNASFV